IVAGGGIHQHGRVIEGDEVTQDLRQLGGAELTRSTGAVRELRQAQPLPLVPWFRGTVVHGRECTGVAAIALRRRPPSAAGARGGGGLRPRALPASRQRVGAAFGAGRPACGRRTTPLSGALPRRYAAETCGAFTRRTAARLRPAR